MLGIFLFGVCEDVQSAKTNYYTSFRQRLSKGFEYVKRETTASLKPLAKVAMTGAALFGAYHLYSGMNDRFVNNTEETLSLEPYFSYSFDNLYNYMLSTAISSDAVLSPYISTVFKAALVLLATSSKSTLPTLLALLPTIKVDAGYTWAQLNPLGDLPLPREGHSANTIGLNMYIFGGYTIVNNTYLNDLWQYASGINAWTKLSPIGKLPPGRTMHSAGTIGSNIYIFGGSNDTNGVTYLSDLWRYASDANTWTQLNPTGELPPANSDHSACSIGSTMYVFGGSNSNGYVTGVWAYNSDSNTWTQFNQTNGYPSSRIFHSANCIGLNMYIFGGASLNELWKYVSNANIWTQLNATVVPSERWRHASSNIGANIYIYGGFTNNGYSNQLWQYNSNTNTWSQLYPTGQLPTARGGLSLTTIGLSLYMFGGFNNSRLNDLWVLTTPTATGTFTHTDTLTPTASATIKTLTKPIRTNLPLQNITLKPGDNFSLSLGQYFTSLNNELLSFMTLANGSTLPAFISLNLNPVLLGNYPAPNQSSGIVVSDTQAFVLSVNYITFSSSLIILDVKDASQIKKLGSYDMSGTMVGLAVANNNAYVIYYIPNGINGLIVLDVSNPTNIVKLGNYTTAFPYEIVLSGTKAFIADHYKGLVILDARNASNITKVGGYITSYAVSVALSGSICYVLNFDSGLVILNISDVSNINKLGDYALSNPSSIVVLGTKAYIKKFDPGMVVLDISDVTNVKPLGNYTIPRSSSGLAVSNAVVGITYYQNTDATYSGLIILDVSNASNIKKLGNISTTGFAYRIAIQGSKAYVADSPAGLQIYDISNWTLSGTPTSNDVGNYSIKITAANAYGQNVSDIFNIAVVASVNASTRTSTNSPTVSFTESITSSVSVATLSWVQLNPIGDKPLERAFTSFTVAGSNIYLFGGGYLNDMYFDLWRYNKNTKLWSKLGQSGNIPTGRLQNSATIIDSCIYMIGGTTSPNPISASDYTNELWIYNITDDRWTKLNTTLPVLRKAHTANKIGLDIYIFGGLNNIDVLNDFWRYSTFYNNWTRITPRTEGPSKRFCHDSGVINSDIYIYAGSDFQTNLKDLWKYSNSTNAWELLTVKEPTPGARECFSFAVIGNDLFLFGGITYVPSETALNDLWQYNSVNNSWRLLPALNKPPIRWGHRIANVGSDIFLFGGQNHQTVYKDLWIINSPSLNTVSTLTRTSTNTPTVSITSNASVPTWSWKQLNSLSVPSSRPGQAGCIIDSKLYVFGGATSSKILNELWKYDSIQNSWEMLNPASGLPTGRGGHSVTKIGPNIYIFGGDFVAGGGGYLNDLWKYSVFANTWTQIFPESGLPRTRVYHSASSIETDLYIFGGFICCQYFNDMWRYSSTNNTWIELTHLTGDDYPSKRDLHSMNTVQSNIYIFGGWNGSNNLNDLWQYNSINDTWSLLSAKSSIPSARNYHAASVIGLNLYIFGGQDESKSLNDLWVYHTTKNAWILLTPIGILPSKRIAMIMDQINSTICLHGGVDNTGSLNDLWFLTKQTNIPDTVSYTNTLTESITPSGTYTNLITKSQDGTISPIRTKVPTKTPSASSTRFGTRSSSSSTSATRSPIKTKIATKTPSTSATKSGTRSSSGSTSATRSPIKTKAATKTISNSISSTSSITKTPIKTALTRIPTATNLLTKSPSNSVSLVPKITQNPTKTFSMTSSASSTQTTSLTPLQTKRLVIAPQTQMPFAPFDNGSKIIINVSYVNNFSILDNSYAKWSIKVGCPIVGTIITGTIIYKNYGHIINAWRNIRYNSKLSCLKCLHKFMKDYKKHPREIASDQDNRIELETKSAKIGTIKISQINAHTKQKEAIMQNLPHWLKYDGNQSLEINDFSVPEVTDRGTFLVQVLKKNKVIEEEFEMILKLPEHSERYHSTDNDETNNFFSFKEVV